MSFRSMWLLLAFAVCLVGGVAPAQAATAPQLGASWATDVTSSSANLHAEVNPEGLATSYRFEYITDAAFQANVAEGHEGFSGAAKQPPGTAASLSPASTFQPALQHVGPLQPTTTYDYRILATNGAGTTPGTAHVFATQEASPIFSLSDARGWEMVSPVEKNGGAIQGFGENFGGGVLQAAAQGGAVTYSSATSFGATPQGAPPASQYVSRRGPGETGWSTENITTATVSGAYGAKPNGVPYQLFSPDLTSGLLLGSRRCRGEGEGCPVANPPLSGTEAPAGYVDYYLRDNTAGGFRALLTGADVAGLALPPEQFELNFAGASPDLGRVVLSTCAALTEGATEVAGTEGCDPTKANLYEWGEGQLKLINTVPGATLAAHSGAVSGDGSRVYFTEGGKLYVREGLAAHQLDEAQGGGGEFQTATPSGAIAFFTKAQHLFSYAATTHTATDLTPSGGVLGVLGASEDGTSVYYATVGGLFLWRSGTTTPVVAIPGAADPSDYPPATGTARISVDGTRLLFLSKASLTGYDNTDANTGLPDSEVYLYDASGAGSLTCISCNPTSERPIGPSSIPGSSANGEAASSTDAYKPRNLAADGRRLFFDSGDALIAQDTDNRPDVYEWEASGEGSCHSSGGCLGLISSGRGLEGASFVDASANGSDAYFLTGESLVPSDPGSVDLYDAREGGGFPVAVPPIECVADACQPLPAGAEDPTVGTLIPGPPNRRFVPKTHKKNHYHKRSHKHATHNSGSHK
jgi:hypothetical protein